MNRSIALVEARMLEVLIALLLIFAFTDAAATPPISVGQVRLEFKSTPTTVSPWEIEISVWHADPLEGGKVLLRLSDSSGGTVSETEIWKGSMVYGDSLALEHSLPPPLAGEYMLAASIVPIPLPRSGAKGISNVKYLMVTDDTVFVHGADPWINRRDMILYELRKRGIDDTTEANLKVQAPDLARRLRELRHPRGSTVFRVQQKPMTAIEDIPPPTDDERDKMAIPGRGPRQRRAQPDSTIRRSVSREPRPPRDMPAPPPRRTPGDSEFGRSEKAQKLRELFQQILDTAQAIPDTAGSFPP